MMSLTAYLAQHAAGVLTVMGFAKNILPYHYYRVSRNEKFVMGYRVCRRLLRSDVFCHILRRQVFRIRLVNAFHHPHFKIKSKLIEQFLSTGRIACQYYFHLSISYVFKLQSHYLINNISSQSSFIIYQSDPAVYQPKAASSLSHLPCALSTCSITSRPTP